MAYQDWLGKDAYIAQAQLSWINTPAIVGVVIWTMGVVLLSITNDKGE